MTVARIALPACAMLLAGCATTAVEMPEAAIAAPVTYAADLPAAGLDEAWWQAFSDPVLDTLIARASVVSSKAPSGRPKRNVRRIKSRVRKAVSGFMVQIGRKASAM